MQGRKKQQRKCTTNTSLPLRQLSFFPWPAPPRLSSLPPKGCLPCRFDCSSMTTLCVNANYQTIRLKRKKRKKCCSNTYMTLDPLITQRANIEKRKLTCVFGLAGFLLQQGDHGPQFAYLILRRVQLHTVERAWDSKSKSRVQKKRESGLIVNVNWEIDLIRFAPQILQLSNIQTQILYYLP